MRVSDQILTQSPAGATFYRVEIPAKPGERPGGRPLLVPMRTQREPTGPDYWTLHPFEAPVDVPEGTFRLRWYRLEGELDDEPEEDQEEEAVEAEPVEGEPAPPEKKRRKRRKRELVEVPAKDSDQVPAVTIKFAAPAEAIPPPPVVPPVPVPASAPGTPPAPSEFGDIDQLLRTVEGQGIVDSASQIRTLAAFRKLIHYSTNRELEVLHRASELVHKAEQTAEQRIQSMVDRGRALEDRMVQQTDRLMGIGEKFLSRVEAAADRVTAPPPAPPPATDWGHVIEKGFDTAKEFGIAVLTDEPHKALAALHGLEIPGITPPKKDLPAVPAAPTPAPPSSPTASATPAPAAPVPAVLRLRDELPPEEAAQVDAILNDPTFLLVFREEAKERAQKAREAAAAAQGGTTP